MSRNKIERNISYDDERKKYYVNLDFGIDPNTGKQVKKSQTFDKLNQARAALRKHEAAKDMGQTVISNAAGIFCSALFAEDTSLEFKNVQVSSAHAVHS